MVNTNKLNFFSFALSLLFKCPEAYNHAESEWKIKWKRKKKDKGKKILAWPVNEKKLRLRIPHSKAICIFYFFFPSHSKNYIMPIEFLYLEVKRDRCYIKVPSYRIAETSYSASRLNTNRIAQEPRERLYSGVGGGQCRTFNLKVAPCFKIFNRTVRFYSLGLYINVKSSNYCAIH